jgi:hypothetical protein
MTNVSQAALSIRGVVHGWKGQKSEPLDGAEVIAFRETKVIGRTKTANRGSFRFNGLQRGAPVVLIVNAEGYAQGKMLCVRADTAETVIDPNLLRVTDLNNWQRIGDELRREIKNLDD